MKKTIQIRNRYFGYSLERLFRFLFCVTQVFNVIGYVSNALEMDSVFSLISQSYIIINVLSFVLFLFSTKRDENAGNAFSLMFLMAITTLLSYFLNPGNCGAYEFILLLCAYLSLPMYMLYVKEIKITRGVLKCILLCNMGTAFFFIYSAHFRPEYHERSGALTMGFFNSNQAAIFLLQNISVLLAMCGLYIKFINRGFILAVCYIEIYLIILTQSRAATVCAWILLYFFFRKSARISERVIKFAAILPVIFISLLQYFADSPFVAGIEIFGKPLLSGREEIFAYTIKAISQSKRWLFGNFGRYLFENLHNAYLSVYASVGILGLLVFYIFFYSQIKSYWKKSGNSVVSKMAFVGLLLLFVEGSVESAVMVSGSMYAAASAPLILLMNVQFKEERIGREDDEINICVQLSNTSPSSIL